MGGINSGRLKRGSGKRLTRDFTKVDINELASQNILIPNSRHDGYIKSKERIYYIVDMTHSDSWIDFFYNLCNGERQMRERTELTKTHPHLGGERFWFVCPLCSRRIGTLFIIINLSCRRCQDLAYASTRGEALRKTKAGNASV